MSASELEIYPSRSVFGGSEKGCPLLDIRELRRGIFHHLNVPTQGGATGVSFQPVFLVLFKCSEMNHLKCVGACLCKGSLHGRQVLSSYKNVAGKCPHGLLNGILTPGPAEARSLCMLFRSCLVPGLVFAPVRKRVRILTLTGRTLTLFSGCCMYSMGCPEDRKGGCFLIAPPKHVPGGVPLPHSPLTSISTCVRVWSFNLLP